MTVSENLSRLEQRLKGISSRLDNPEIGGRLIAITDAANDVGRAWSGSYLGYQSRVYYKGFHPVPQGCHFSIEWGFNEVYGDGGTVGDWMEVSHDELIKHIHRVAGATDLTVIREASARATATFEEVRSLADSVISKCEATYKNDRFFREWTKKIHDIQMLPVQDIGRLMLPGHQIISRDMLALQGGTRLPPHREVQAQVLHFKMPFMACEDLAKILYTLSVHLEEDMLAPPTTTGRRIFIGHGHSAVWKDLRDFLDKRLRLEWDEFNRVPAAGVSTETRLSQMLDDSVFAFLVLTAEDEKKEGQLIPRLNVVHEAGLFQGKLGFKRAIILLEEGCHGFSNIEGLGQIRFPEGQISACFEEIRRVLEREGFILPA